MLPAGSFPRLLSACWHSPDRLKFLFRWTSPRPAPAPAPRRDECDARLAELLCAAGRIRYYRRRGLQPFETNLSPSAMLARMPRVELEYFLRNPEGLYDWG